MSRLLCVSVSLATGLLVAWVHDGNWFATNEIVSHDSLVAYLGGCGNMNAFQIACDQAGADPSCPPQPMCEPVGNICAIIVTSANQECATQEGFNCSAACSGHCGTQQTGTQGTGGTCTTCPNPGTTCGAQLCTTTAGKC
jgi:hypothetical protein